MSREHENSVVPESKEHSQPQRVHTEGILAIKGDAEHRQGTDIHLVLLDDRVVT